MSKHLDLAKKLKSLADKGVGGEKINAEKMLRDLCDKHGISIDDLENDETHIYWFDLKTDFEKKFLNQMAKRVNYSLDVYFISAKKAKKLNVKTDGNVFIECSACEYIEIESMYVFYYNLYEQELDVFYRAFLTANDLLGQPPDDEKKSEDDLSKEELEKFRRAQQMSESIKSESFRKQLNKTNK